MNSQEELPHHKELSPKTIAYSLGATALGVFILYISTLGDNRELKKENDHLKEEQKFYRSVFLGKSSRHFVLHTNTVMTFVFTNNSPIWTLEENR